MQTSAFEGEAQAGKPDAGSKENQGSPTSTSGTSTIKHRKSLTQSIRARLLRQSSSENHRSPGTTAQPPVPSIPRSYSSPGSLAASSSMHSSGTMTTISSISANPTEISQPDLEAAWSTVLPPAFPMPLLYTACYCEENVYLLVQHLTAQLELVNRAAANIARKRFANKGARKQVVSPTASPCSTLFVPVWDVHALFISNASKTVLLYQQNASKLPNAGSPVIWDYHAVAAATCHLVPLHELVLLEDGSVAIPACFQQKQLRWSRTWIYDSDSRLASTTSQPCVVPFAAYNQGTFRPEAIAAGVVPQHFQPCFRVVPANDFVELFASDRSHMLTATSDDEGVARQVWSSPPPSWEAIVGPKARQLEIRTNLMDQYVDMAAQDDENQYGTVWDARTWLGQKCIPDNGALGASLGRGSPPKITASTHEQGSIVLNTLAAMVEPRDMHGLRMPQSSAPTIPSTNQDAGQETPDNSPKGGRIASPLFPAYLHASQQHRSRPPPTPPSSV